MNDVAAQDVMDVLVYKALSSYATMYSAWLRIVNEAVEVASV